MCGDVLFYQRAVGVPQAISSPEGDSQDYFLFNAGAKGGDGEIGATGASLVTEVRIFKKIVDL